MMEMKIDKGLLLTCIMMVLLTSISAAAETSLTIDLRPDGKNPSAPIMGNHLKFLTAITNTGGSTVEGLVAWISLVEIDPGNEQPMDLEDWSAHKAVSGASLKPGETLHTEWPMRLIKSGDYRVLVSVANRGGRDVLASRTIEFHVRQKPVLQAGRIVPVAMGIPLVFAGLLLFAGNKKRRWRKSD
jgi:hypothetical protein